MGKYQVLGGKVVIGLAEKVNIQFDKGKKNVIAKIDTGATKSSIDTNLAAELRLGPVIKSKLVKSAHGSKLRPIIEATIELAGKKIKSEFTLADRAHMKYRILIGQNILKDGFLIDPTK
ncbi:ATP-dependent zinc protease [Candidatus Woesearchaeota archaeon]|nr:ATP-dependent zinc protease [Candidatus Woesearchaeota archaeon]